MVIMTISAELQRLLLGKFVVLTTVTPDNKPNAIMVEVNRVLDNDTILITDNFMQQTVLDISSNDRAAILVWTDNLSKSYKILGRVHYYNSGKYLEMLRPLNKGYPCKGAVVVEVTNIIESA